MVKICRKRLKYLCKQLNKQGFQYYQIHRGNALQKKCITEFSGYHQTHYNEEYIDDLDYAQRDYNDLNAKIKIENKQMQEEELW